jgi:hypothetical protein
MEIDSSNLLNYIKIYDNIMNKDTLDIFKKICDENPNFNDASVVGTQEVPNVVDKKIRDVQCWDLANLGEKSRTNIFWTNYLSYIFNEYIGIYAKDTEIQEQGKCSLLNMQVLKYKENGKYIFHVDHGYHCARTISCIFFLNDDYEGGELCFKFPGNIKEFSVEKKANRMIVWPSNFLYPHAVKPVTKGTRYSVVAWAL